MSTPKPPGFDTLSLHAGAVPDPATGARATPIYLSSAFVFKDSDHAASLFNMERAGHVYSRISNPTNAVLEERIAALEGGVAGIAVASGQAALHLALVAERQGHPGQALAALATMLDPAHAKQMSERRLWLADAVRLALAVGDPDTARAAAEAGAADAATEPTPSRTAAAEHCAGLIDGDPSRLLAAAAGYRGVGRPVQLAQALEDAAVMLAGHSDVPAASA